LRLVLDIDNDFSEQASKNLEDISSLCVAYNIQPCQPNEGDLVELIDQQIKNVMFEYSYLNEKIYKRNNKMKSILHPALQRKQILEGVLKSLWQSHLKIAKESGDKSS
jgi:hypothetical protein